MKFSHLSRTSPEPLPGEASKQPLPPYVVGGRGEVVVVESNCLPLREMGEVGGTGPGISTAGATAPTIAVMSKASAEKDGEKRPTALARAEGGRFAVGHKGGPGRPKKGLSLAENWRRETDWQAVRERLEKIVTGKSRDADAVAAARELCDRAWGKPLSSHELRVTQGAPEPSDGERLESMLTDAELAVIDQAHERLALASGHTEPAESRTIDVGSDE